LGAGIEGAAGTDIRASIEFNPSGINAGIEGGVEATIGAGIRAVGAIQGCHAIIAGTEGSAGIKAAIAGLTKKWSSCQKMPVWIPFFKGIIQTEHKRKMRQNDHYSRNASTSIYCIYVFNLSAVKP